MSLDSHRGTEQIMYQKKIIPLQEVYVRHDNVYSIIRWIKNFWNDKDCTTGLFLKHIQPLASSSALTKLIDEDNVQSPHFK